MTDERHGQGITVSAKTVADAIAEAERRLGLRREEIDITVLNEGSKGFLGMGGENARIIAMPVALLTRRAPDVPRTSSHLAVTEDAPLGQAADQLPLDVPAVSVPVAEQHAPAQPLPAAPAVVLLSPEPEGDARRQLAPVPEQPESGDDESDQPQPGRADPTLVAEVAIEVVRELLVRLDLDAQAVVRSAGNPVVIDITGEDLGLLIGRHGETLGSLQYIVNSIVGKRVSRWCKVIVDVEHYRQRREDTLRALATRQAARVRQWNREIALDPMPAAERRVVHMVLQNSPFVVTSSAGEEPNRRVVIAPRQAPQ